MATSTNKVSIAIIGAGVSSLVLARGLLQHPKIDFKIYEARPQIGQQDGSGVGIGANGQKAMEVLDHELMVCLKRAGAVDNVPSLRTILAMGPQAGEMITEMYSDPPQRTVLRRQFLAELMKILPEGVIETNKKLTSISNPEGEGRITLTFEDGTKTEVDGVVGADGVNSFIRKQILPATSNQPQWGKRFNTRVVIPMTQAMEIFGKDYCTDPIHTGWIGHEGFCLTDAEDDGNAMQVIAGFEVENPGPEIYGKPYAPVSAQFWIDGLKEWGWIGEKISEVMRRQEKPFASHARAKDDEFVYAKGKLCLAGDSCGNFSPALGAGAGQAIEDAVLLSTVLGCVKGPKELEKAFKVYGDIRKPRREWTAEKATVQLENITGTREGVGLDKEKLAKAIHEPYDQLYAYDQEAAVERAKRMMTA